MKKKYGFIFLGLGIILLLLYPGFGFNRSSISKNDDKMIFAIKEKIADKNKYNYIKSRDINKKTKVTFQILSDFYKYGKYFNDFNRLFRHKYLPIDYRATIVEFDKPLDEYIKTLDNTWNSMYKNNNYQTSITNIECKYLCRKYSAYQDDLLYQEQFDIIIKLSDVDIAMISYYSGNSISNNIINEIVNGITITNDAAYKIGKIDNDKLTFDFELESDKIVTFSVDSSTYVEVEDSNNTLSSTIIKNKNTSATLSLNIINKGEDLTINERIDKYMGLTPSSKKMEYKILDNIVYEYEMGGMKNYAVIIDDSNALIIIANGDFDIKDFFRY